MKNLEKKIWEKPVVCALSVKKETASGAAPKTQENPTFHIKGAAAS